MNLKGGYKILSLVTLVLIASVDGTTATDITDVNTLEQLDSLKEYLDVSKQLKPILLRVKPSKEKVVMAELSRVDDVTLMIHAKLDGYELNIVVSFEQDEETLLWSIDDAQYLYVKTVNSEVGIKGLIQADKDILSQIEYDLEEVTTVIFPKGILPLRVINSNGIFYFDYDNLILLASDGQGISGCEIILSSNGIRIIDNEDFFINEDIETIEYILRDDNEDNDLYLNTYYIFYPITSAGTKLYIHEIHIDTTDESIEFHIISVSQNPYNLPNTAYDLYVGREVVCVSAEELSDLWLQLPYELFFIIGGQFRAYISQTLDYTSTGTITSITDTVTEL